MTWNAVKSKITFTGGMAAADQTTILASIETGYKNSAIAKKMLDDWVGAGKSIEVHHLDDHFQAWVNAGKIDVDLDYIKDATMIDNKGNGADVSVTRAVLHELVHATLGLRDNWNADMTDWRGDTVAKTNEIMAQIDAANPARNSYISVDINGDVIKSGFAFTGGAAIDRSVEGDRSWNTEAGGDRDDLVIGGPGANTLEAGLGDDWLFGGGGNDILNGGVGGTDTVRLDGNAVDYDIRLNADGTWTSKHLRGEKDEGTDTFKNLEKVMFNDGTFNLAKGGLSYQTDFAIVVDNSGSMGDDIAAVKTASTDIVNALFADGKTDARIGVTVFSDTTYGEPTLIALPFTDQDVFADRKAAALSAINGIGLRRGGDAPESAFDGLLKALDGSMGEWRAGAGTKRIALFTDADARDYDLLPTVATLAADIGATVTDHSAAAFEYGQTDTFELMMPAPAAAGFGPDMEPDEPRPPDYVPSGDPVEAPGSVGKVAITTIWVGSYGEPADGLAKVAEDSGGAVLRAADADDVAKAILDIVTTPHYTITTPTSELVEGNSGRTSVTFTLARDRAEGAATVTLETTGKANGDDVKRVPTTVDFADGQMTQDVTVKVLGDKVFEGNEVFGLKITDVSVDATFDPDASKFTILNDDRLVGTRYADKLLGKNGDDVIVGKGGNDLVKGRAGDDVLKGMAGNDKLIGGIGNDKLKGFAGNDVLKGQAGDDLIIGGAGADKIIFGTGDGHDTVRGFDLGIGLPSLRAVSHGGVHDRIDLRGLAEITDWAALSDPMGGHMTQVGDDVLIDSLAGDSMLLLATLLGDLEADHFIF